MKNKIPAIAESLVIEHLKRMFEDNIFFWKNGYEIDAVILEKNKLYGFEMKWSEKAYNIKKPSQIKEVFLITKKEYSKNLLKIPLAVFLIMFDV